MSHLTPCPQIGTQKPKLLAISQSVRLEVSGLKVWLLSVTAKSSGKEMNKDHQLKVCFLFLYVNKSCVLVVDPHKIKSAGFSDPSYQAPPHYCYCLLFWYFKPSLEAQLIQGKSFSAVLIFLDGFLQKKQRSFQNRCMEDHYHVAHLAFQGVTVSASAMPNWKLAVELHKLCFLKKTTEQPVQGCLMSLSSPQSARDQIRAVSSSIHSSAARNREAEWVLLAVTEG